MLRKLLEFLRINRQYFFVSSFLLIGWTLYGFFYADTLEAIVQENLKHLIEKVEEFNQDPSIINMFWLIFKNNVIIALGILALGVFFGIAPFMSLFVNGTVIGYVLNKTQEIDVNPFTLLVFGILPHGVIEILAILFAAMIGLKFGVLSFKFLGSAFSRRIRSNLKEEYLEHLNYLPYMVIVIIVMLFIAAIIETTITPLLIHYIMGDNVNLLGP